MATHGGGRPGERLLITIAGHGIAAAGLVEGRADGAEPQLIAGHPAQSLYPGLALVILVVCVTMLGRRIGQGADER